MRARELNVNFVETEFIDCQFSGFTATNHFTGADDVWRRCRFDRLQLFRTPIPGNVFEDYQFIDCFISGWVGSNTTFRRCVFGNLTVVDRVVPQFTGGGLPI